MCRVDNGGGDMSNRVTDIEVAKVMQQQGCCIKIVEIINMLAAEPNE